MIILQILKIIGIVLACIIGLVLVILLLVLFAPVNYSAGIHVSGSDINVKASAGWLFKLLSVKAEYAEKSFSYSMRAAGISILSSEEKEKKNKKISTDEPGFPKGSGASDDFDYFDENKFEGSLSETEEKTEIPAEKPAPEPAWREDESDKRQEPFFGEAPPQKKRRSPIEIIREKITSFIQKIKDSYEKIKRMYEKAKTVKYIACAPVTRKALAYAKDRLFKLLKSIRPRSIKGSITIGTEDPLQSALIYGALAAVSAQLSKKLYVYPELENKKTDIDVVIRGRIVIGYIALMALQIYTNKDVNRVIRYIRRNLLNGG